MGASARAAIETSANGDIATCDLDGGGKSPAIDGVAISP
jgi:hypothetical protein